MNIILRNTKENTFMVLSGISCYAVVMQRIEYIPTPYIVITFTDGTVRRFPQTIYELYELKIPTTRP